MREKIVQEARSWLDTPFRHGAGVKGAGCDCAHLITEVYFALGLIPKIEFPIYGPDWWRHAEDPERYIVEAAKKYFDEIKAAEAQPGDWVTLYMGKAFAHCAIITGPKTVVEAWPSRSKVSEINTSEERNHRNRAKRYFRARGIV